MTTFVHFRARLRGLAGAGGAVRRARLGRARPRRAPPLGRSTLHPTHCIGAQQLYGAGYQFHAVGPPRFDRKKQWNFCAGVPWVAVDRGCAVRGEAAAPSDGAGSPDASAKAVGPRPNLRALTIKMCTSEARHQGMLGGRKNQ